jgi:hypothetical protein
VSSLPEQSSVAGELVANIGRDIQRYVSADDPNRKVAGEAALRGLNAAIRVLGTARHRLLLELYGNDQTATAYAAEKLTAGGYPIREVGNSGPGF